MKKAVSVGMAVAAAAVWLVLFGLPQVLPQKNESLIGACHALPAAAGVGDITIDSARGVAYLVYLDRTPKAEGRPPSGTVMLVDLNAKEPRVRAALVTDPPDFRPFALSLYVPAQGARRLFVVDVGTSPASVQVFEQSAAGGFALLSTIRDPLLGHLTGIVAVGADQFYATTDATWLDPATSSRFARWQQISFPALRASALAESGIVFYDGQRVRRVASGLPMPVGIDASPDNSVIYVATLSAKRLEIFARDSVTGELKAQESVKLPSLPDHVYTDAAGNVWIAAHPGVTAALKSLAGTTTRAPSEVLKFSPTGPFDARVTSLYRNDGSELAGAVTAAAHGDRVIIGSWIDRKLLLCESKTRL